MPIVKSKILKRRITGEITIVDREQLEKDIVDNFSEELEESQIQRSLADEINVVDRGLLLQVKNTVYCAIDLDPGEIYSPPVAGVIIEAWKRNLVKSSEIDPRLKPYKKAFKR